ncbi:glutathionylspermidine synthase family protein [Luteibacter aegosomatis]|uniref:glutathionylspermidine synthase family protein n=1 Tax=Luteibacter aegosomatis TaxID=2911537 RepID=UPI001FFA81EB|nr:glutathionylspermidine synthase family protein [Luteibacter aegosomatis]UPG85705.1 glutathionylspermidine synthase family protein [Luteibacter aegosomatis]
MRRETIRPRDDWQREVEAVGFGFHTVDGQPYWREDACYVFDEDAIDEAEVATRELHALCLDAVDRIVRDGRYDQLGIGERGAALAERSWWNRDPSLYGRMDLSWDGQSPPKLLEYNADTPTSLFEASVVQWYWLEARYPDADQFNSIHEKLIERWRTVGGGQRVHFAACYDNPEDGTTTDYLLDTCMQAGHEVQALDIEEIGWSGRDFIDLADRPIDRLFKLYPWEWLLDEAFGEHIPTANIRWIEPPWKMLLSNKAILPLLWEFFPGHPNLLPASLRREDIPGTAVAKPYWGREGEGIAILDPHQGAVLAPQRVYQALAPLPVFDGRHALVGSWIVGDEPAGIGIREDGDRITRNTSCFVPHLFR